MSETKTVKVINANAESVWAKLKAFDGMDEILPSMITACEVEGEGVGAKRVCSTENGPIKETLASIDDTTMTFSYTIDNDDAPIPVTGYKGTASVKALPDGTSEVTWSATYEPQGMPEEEIQGMLLGAMDGIISGLENVVGR